MSEEEVCKKAGLDKTKNSGRGMIKGDFTWKYFVGDIKEGKSLTFNQSVWAKNCSDALSHGFGHSPMILRVLPNGNMIACIEFSELKYLFDENEYLKGKLEENGRIS